MKELESFIAECEKNAVPDSEINLTDAPELMAADFARGHFKHWKPLKKAATFHNTTGIARKETIREAR